jgi:hypothetical protein
MDQLKSIFELIKKLDQHEKNNFVALSNIKSDSNQKEYFLLYKLLESEAVLNNDKIYELYSSRKNEKLLANDLVYLEEQIFHSLQISKRYDSAKHQVYAKIILIENLISKELYKLANKEIKKALQICKNQDLLPVSLILNEYKNFCDFFLQGSNSENTQIILKELVDDSYELYISKKVYYICFEFAKSKQSYDKTKDRKYLEQMTDNYTEFKKIYKFINRELTINESLLEDKIRFEYTFTIKKYHQSIIHINNILKIIEKDIDTEIQAFWVYLNFIWCAFESCCLSNKKITAKSFMNKANEYSRLKIIKSNESYIYELDKFILKMKIQYMLFFEDYSMLKDYTIKLAETINSNTDFTINSLSKSKVQLSICYLLNNQINKSYELIDEVTRDEKFEMNYDYKICYYLIKTIYEIHQKQYDLSDYSLKNFYRFIKSNSNNLEYDTSIYKLFLQVHKHTSLGEKFPKQLNSIKKDNLLLYSFILSYL